MDRYQVLEAARKLNAEDSKWLRTCLAFDSTHGSEREKLAELRRHLDRQGGRGIELAEEIDNLACELGDCIYSETECERDSHATNKLSTN